DPDTLRKVEARMTPCGGCLLQILDRPSAGHRLVRWVRRTVVGESLSLTVARLPKWVGIPGWKARLSPGPGVALRPLPGDDIAATWGREGAPALLRRSNDRLAIWAAGFPLDHLDVKDLGHLLETVMTGGLNSATFVHPLPDGA